MASAYFRHLFSGLGWNRLDWHRPLADRVALIVKPGREGWSTRRRAGSTTLTFDREQAGAAVVRARLLYERAIKITHVIFISKNCRGRRQFLIGPLFGGVDLGLPRPSLMLSPGFPIFFFFLRLWDPS
jgi:hypothetical protein